MVFAVVIIGELLAFILTLAAIEGGSDSWNNLGLLSLYIQWQGLTISAILCFLRTRLSHLHTYLAVTLTAIIILISLVTIAEIVFLIQQQLRLGIVSASFSNLEFVIHTFLIGGIISLLALRYFYVKHQLVLQIKAESETRLQALQWRIRPHFLFNSMNTIAAMIGKQPKLAETLLENFAELFRYVLRENAPLVSVEEELSLLKDYLQIEQIRLDERLKINWAIESLPLDAQIPVMTLQPLLENAIYHGIEPFIDGGELSIAGQLDGKNINITITNPWQEEAHQHRKGNQIAMDNINKRLELHFNSQASLKLIKQQDFCQVELRFPYSKLIDK